MTEENFSESTFSIPLIATPLLIGIELIVAFISGCGFIALGADGGAWILGGIVAGALAFYSYRSFYNNQAKPNRKLRKLGQILVGLTVGFSITNADFAALAFQLPTFIGLALFLLVSGGAIGCLYARIEKTDLLTALLATVPGNIGVMASIAADYGKSAPLVSLVQLMRFTAVILVVPLIINLPASRDVGGVLLSVANDLSNVNLSYLFLLASLLIIATLTVYLGEKLNVPVAAFLCSIVAGAVFNSSLELFSFSTAVDFELPSLLNLLGQILLGVTIGEYWGVNPRFEKRTIASAVIPVALVFSAGFVSASIAKVITSWDWLTCLLVTSPGGSPEMILIALTLHHDVEIVTGGHLVRLIAINISLPLLVSVAHHLERRSAQSQSNIAVPSNQSE